MLSYIYVFFFIVSFVLTIVLAFKFDNKISIHYYFMFLCIMFSSFGYMQLATASDVKSALYANQAIYLGSSFCPFFFLRVMADLCKYKMNKVLQISFLIFGAIIFSFISSIGVSGLYYKSVSIGSFMGITYLEKEYGPLHNLYLFYLIGIFVAAIFYITKAFIQKKDVAYRNGYILAGLLLFVLITYVLEKILPYHLPIVPLGYSVSEIGVLILLSRISLYNVTEISIDSMYESEEYGFFVTDTSGLFLGADVACKKWFPEVKELKIEKNINIINSRLVEQVNKWMNSETENEIALISNNGLIIEAKHTIIDKRKNKIHCIYLRDDTKEQEYKRLIEDFNKELESQVEIKTEQIIQMQDDIIISMASIVENRDSNTGGHVKRTSDVIKIFVEYLDKDEKFEELDKQYARCIIKAAPLHDFGKIAIPDVILNKPGKFTIEEYEEMKKHPAKGAIIVERILQNSSDEQFKKVAVNVAHYHHEKWAGGGYPENLTGETIPFEARVMALADVFDALVSKRVYKDKFSYDEAFKIIEESSGSHFDPLLCEKFLECKDELIKLYDSYVD